MADEHLWQFEHNVRKKLCIKISVTCKKMFQKLRKLLTFSHSVLVLCKLYKLKCFDWLYYMYVMFLIKSLKSETWCYFVCLWILWKKHIFFIWDHYRTTFSSSQIIKIFMVFKHLPQCKFKFSRTTNITTVMEQLSLTYYFCQAALCTICTYDPFVHCQPPIFSCMLVCDPHYDISYGWVAPTRR